DANFDTTIAGVHSDWDQLLPEVKRAILDRGRALHVDPLLAGLELSDEDTRALEIRWDLAESLYAAHKPDVMAQCKAEGFDLLDLKAPFVFKEDYPHAVAACTKHLLALLTYRADCDLAALAHAGVLDDDRMRGRAVTNLRNEKVDLLDQFRGVMVEM